MLNEDYKIKNYTDIRQIKVYKLKCYFRSNNLINLIHRVYEKEQEQLKESKKYMRKYIHYSIDEYNKDSKQLADAKEEYNICKNFKGISSNKAYKKIKNLEHIINTKIKYGNSELATKHRNIISSDRVKKIKKDLRKAGNWLGKLPYPKLNISLEEYKEMDMCN